MNTIRTNIAENKYIMISKSKFYAIRCALLVLCLLFAHSSYAQKKKVPANSIEAKVDTLRSAEPILHRKGVVPFGDTLFYIYANIGTFSSSDRALSITEKIKNLGDDLLFQEDSLKIVDYSGYLTIMYEDNVIMSVDSLQAEREASSRVELAHKYREQIIEAVYLQHKNTSWQHILLQVVGTIAIIVAEYIIIKKLIRYLYRRSALYIRRKRKRLKGFSSFIDTQRTVSMIISVVKVVRLILVLFFLYLGLTVLFKLFPYTKHLSDELLSYIIVPVKSFLRSIINYMPKLFTIIVIVVIFRYIWKFLHSVAEKIQEQKIVIKGFYPDWAKPTYNIVRALLFIFMFILIFPYLPQSDSGVFQGVSVFAGIMLSLGSTSIIGNLVAGLVITYMRPFKIGDRIKIGDNVGNVIEKTALVTRIKTPKNEIITIPNSNIMSAQTVNYSYSAEQHGLILYMTVCVGYDVPWQKSHEMLLEVASRTENLSKWQKPFVLQDGFNDFYVEYQLNVYIKNANLTSKVYSDLRQNAQDVFAENNIEMISPHYRVSKKVDDFEAVPPSAKKEE